MNELLSSLVSWLPFFLLMAIWLLFSRGTIRRSNLGVELMRESIELQKKTNACLEEIKAELKAR
jgi:hypothetical protein